MADQEIESAIQSAIAANKINGAVICATNTTDTFTYTRALGTHTLLSGETKPLRTDDILFLASATKLIATIAALQCVEDGLLSLDADTSKIIPELAAQQVLAGFAADETPQLEPQARPITLRMLLTHTSGVAYDFLVPKLMRYRKETGQVPPPAGRRRVEAAFAYPLAFQPGTGWMYGPGLDWAGRIVERVTGRTLGERVRVRICRPLGIPEGDAQFYPVTGCDERVVDLNPGDPKGLGLGVVNGADMNSRSEGDFGGHGLFMTGEGYLKVLGSLLRNDGRLLGREMVTEMFRNQINGEMEEGFRDAMAGPIGPFFSVGVDVETKTGYGLGGLLTMEDVEGWYGQGTLTWGGGATFAWFVDPKTGLCGLAAIHLSLPADDGLVADLKQSFRHDIFRKYASWKQSGSS
ncbi:acyltransferase LovD [Echria macrotheca]|uniref:Acyltransferase LovD n=1 Tax=Echria macrotheca TaxID=438768 RepID=A0AAJ0F6M8_9PEZI|nr:acyltransferase LovD [Echria macrotheca]